MKQDTIRLPIIPQSKNDPTGQERYADQAGKEFSRRIRNIRLKYESMLRSLRVKKTTTISSGIFVNKAYYFDIDEYTLDLMQSEMNDYIYDQLGSRDASNWFFDEFVKRAYDRGTRAEFVNLATQAGIADSIGQRMMTEAYRTRISLVKYRVFEEMQNLTASVKADMSRVLADGIANGHRITKISDQLKRMEGINDSRARTIARTEVLNAYRTARSDEGEQARIDYGLRTGELWISALSPTSRDSHTARHGKVFTKAENDEFQSKDANAINCKCTRVNVLVDADGNPINDILVKRLIRMKDTADAYLKEQ